MPEVVVRPEAFPRRAGDEPADSHLERQGQDEPEDPHRQRSAEAPRAQPSDGEERNREDQGRSREHRDLPRAEVADGRREQQRARDAVRASTAMMSSQTASTRRIGTPHAPDHEYLAASFTIVFTPRNVARTPSAFSNLTFEKVDSLCRVLHSQYISRPFT